MSKDPLRLPSTAFLKEDPSDDALFYRPARLVTHIDEAAIGALTGRYAELIVPGSTVLDLMSSWVSHLPPDLHLREVVGHGMNVDELAANPRLSRWFVQDLNRNAELPLESASVDTVLICVGVQYLQRPMEVFAEVRRILRPRGIVIVSYSNRCFPTKAISVWLDLDMRGRAALIRGYLEGAGFAAVSAKVLADGRHSDPLVAVEGRAWRQGPTSACKPLVPPCVRPVLRSAEFFLNNDQFSRRHAPSQAVQLHRAGTMGSKALPAASC